MTVAIDTGTDGSRRVGAIIIFIIINITQLLLLAMSISLKLLSKSTIAASSCQRPLNAKFLKYKQRFRAEQRPTDADNGAS